MLLAVFYFFGSRFGVEGESSTVFPISISRIFADIFLSLIHI